MLNPSAPMVVQSAVVVHRNGGSGGRRCFQKLGLVRKGKACWQSHALAGTSMITCSSFGGSIRSITGSQRGSDSLRRLRAGELESYGDGLGQRQRQRQLLAVTSVAGVLGGG